MTDIFFSYSSKDRDRVAVAHAALTERGFDVLWDLQVPAAVDWEQWIAAPLRRARCVVVFWTGNSAASDKVRHEADIAREQGKLLQVLLEPMGEPPLGGPAEQAVNLIDWQGNTADLEWIRLIAAVEEKAAPLWVRHKITGLERALKAARQKLGEADARVQRLVNERDDLEAERNELLSGEGPLIDAEDAGSASEKLRWTDVLLMAAVLSAALVFLPRLAETALLHWKFIDHEYDYVELIQKPSFFVFLGCILTSWLTEEETEGGHSAIIFGVLAAILFAFNWAIENLVPFNGWWQFVYLLPPMFFGLLAASFLSEVFGKKFR
ncbi:MAG: toll/interleukin-1 receptor domain-containing protein [Rhodomicrobium sp.]